MTDPSRPGLLMAVTACQDPHEEPRTYLGLPPVAAAHHHREGRGEDRGLDRAEGDAEEGQAEAEHQLALPGQLCDARPAAGSGRR